MTGAWSLESKLPDNVPCAEDMEWRFCKVHQRPNRIMETRVMWIEILKGPWPFGSSRTISSNRTMI